MADEGTPFYGMPTLPTPLEPDNTVLSQLISEQLAEPGVVIKVEFRKDGTRFASMLPPIDAATIEATADAAAEWVRSAIMLAAATKGVKP